MRYFEICDEIKSICKFIEDNGEYNFGYEGYDYYDWLLAYSQWAYEVVELENRNEMHYSLKDFVRKKLMI